MKIDIVENIINNEIEKFKKHEKWYSLLRMFLLSQDFKDIFYQLYEFYKEGRRFTPELKYVFIPFQKLDPEDIDVLLMFDKPYSAIGLAKGIPLIPFYDLKKKYSYSTPELHHVSSVLNKSFYAGRFQLGDPKRILSIHSTFTTDTSIDVLRKNSLKHYEIWNPFISFVLSQLSQYDIIYGIIGDKPKKYYYNTISDKCIKICCDNIPELFSSDIVWNHNDIFPKINDALIAKGKKEIVW